ncbi:MAG TPA: ATP-binding protein [Candidatus Sulfotelmatobacter sp.]|jgi:PAS domain S-box-containing protein|nr:ATP-binding protein [Candidatus Sulfotelmatobacter sp.]
MSFFANLPIRYKLYSGFLLIFIVFICFSIYLLFSANNFYQSFVTLADQTDKRILYSALYTNTTQLSDAVKSYMLTKDPKWEKVYDNTSIQLQNSLSNVNSTTDQVETEKLTEFKLILTKLQGVELLILAKTSEGDSSGALKLFDTYYISQQAHLETLSNDLSTNAAHNFDVTLSKNNIIINQGKVILGVMLFFVILLSLLIGYYFSLLIEKSIKKLLLSVNKIAAGDLSTRVEISSQDEIGKLAVSFNSMAKQLQQLYNNLEGKIQEKTKELTETVTILGQEKTKDEAILESIGDGMIVTDNNGIILLMNTVAQQMFNLQNNSFIGKSAYTLFQLQQLDNDPVPQEKRPISVALQTRNKVIETFNFVGNNQKNLVVSITATPVIEQNQTIGVVEIFRDITKEKEIDRMKTEFISLASHQLRTPLSAIKWFSEMLVGGDAGKLTDEQQDFAQNISDSTQRMIELVNSLLNISRIESGRILVDPKPTDLKELVENIVKELQIKITQRQQNLIISVHADLPKVNLDPKLIRQVYMNLLTNAIKYTPKGGDITIFISKKGEEVVSQVTDNGYGIPKTEQTKIFKKFFRAENIIKIETDGTGLGLYLIKAIIDSSNGKIWFESEENKGTTFWFSLPITGMQAKKGEVTLDE